ncbi:MAG: hypothetical protein HWD63_04205 [Candidatus Parvibacillus calidus]|nr:MAG: hypothetical protein HWD63_04205 [Candidatus Parvibacillus calidus]
MTDAQTIEQLTAENKLLLEQNSTLKHETDTLKRLIFGSRSERFKPVMYNPDQLSLLSRNSSLSLLKFPRKRLPMSVRRSIRDAMPYRTTFL